MSTCSTEFCKIICTRKYVILKKQTALLPWRFARRSHFSLFFLLYRVFWFNLFLQTSFVLVKRSKLCMPVFSASFEFEDLFLYVKNFFNTCGQGTLRSSPWLAFVSALKYCSAEIITGFTSEVSASRFVPCKALYSEIKFSFAVMSWANKSTKTESL